ncbi:ATP-binding protein [Marivirga harenae]|uniref:ATP-binding protein n=1 Tax=Marivirga harenae TaxID=2010992 RepID=UPI0026DFBD75|nr:ATP-binding protein [Marivirga harenae]WKV13767.1 ATP-binding protein [Marivirga harenae]|tara:strand:- start:65783 stop:66199 length:417 start_codon:yes stop_codon:yes gene_type:complete
MKFNLKVYCEKTRLKDIREFITEKLKAYVHDDLEINQMVLAVDEICANLIIHSNYCNANEAINLEVFVEKDGVTFEISDEGEKFDIKKYKEPSIQEVVQTKKKGGIGLMLVRRIMDKVEFKNEEEKNTCILHKRFKSQ